MRIELASAECSWRSSTKDLLLRTIECVKTVPAAEPVIFKQLRNFSLTCLSSFFFELFARLENSLFGIDIRLCVRAFSGGNDDGNQSPISQRKKNCVLCSLKSHTSSSKNVVARLVFVARFFDSFFDNVIPFASWTHNSSPSHKKVFIFFSNKKFLFSRRKPFMVLIYVDPRAVSTSCFFFGCLFFLYLLVKWPIYFSSRPKHVSRAGLSDRLDDKNARNKFRFLSTRQSLLHRKKNLTEFLKYRKRRFGVTLSYTYIGTESTEECVAYQLLTPQSSSTTTFRARFRCCRTWERSRKVLKPVSSFHLLWQRRRRLATIYSIDGLMACRKRCREKSTRNRLWIRFKNS